LIASLIEAWGSWTGLEGTSPITADTTEIPIWRRSLRASAIVVG